jgi:hypothetical protein
MRPGQQLPVRVFTIRTEAVTEIPLRMIHFTFRVLITIKCGRAAAGRAGGAAERAGAWSHRGVGCLWDGSQR